MGATRRRLASAPVGALLVSQPAIGKNARMLITPEHLRQTYLNSVITIELQGTWMSPDEALDRLGQPIIVVTASNPEHKVLTDAENRALNRDLFDQLLAGDLDVLPARGTSPDTAWQEEGWAVLGLTQKWARGIWRSWGQDAIFELRDGQQRVLGCFSSWVRSRSLTCEDDWSSELPTFSAAVASTLGVSVSTGIARAEWPGWSHDGDLHLPCPECSTSLHLFGADLVSKAGAPYRSSIFVCTEEPRALLPNEVPKPYLGAARARRAYLISADDADVRGDLGRSYWAYVIELSDEIEQPAGVTKPWVYVGQSSRTPGERFEQHRSGYKASKWVKNYGVRLLPDLYRDQPVLRTQAEALSYEAWLAAHLEAHGFPVKGGH